MTARKLHKGVSIVPVKITRYEVRRFDGKVMRTFATAARARAWVDGYSKAVEQLTKERQP